MEFTDKELEEVAPLTDEQWHHAIEFAHKQRGIYANEMYGNWLTENEKERKLRQLAETYHDECELYDRRVCSGTSPRTGEAMPVNPDEMRLSNQHALEMRKMLIEEGLYLGFTARQVEEAIKKWVKSRPLHTLIAREN